MNDESPYKMSISLNVLHHLGIGLYSNVPAVLSEVVANAWDADATEVHIYIDPSEACVSIQDNGCGMSKQDINDKYLKVGYQRRQNEPGKTPVKGRNPMGRKGIGKLSVFSIAKSVEVHSVKGSERNALAMNLDAIESLIKDGSTKDYRPDPLDTSLVAIPCGTRIILRELKKNLGATEGFLRKRLARRFSVLGSLHDFRVWINDNEITAKDRDYFDNIEFMWCIGTDGVEYKSVCPSLRESFTEAGDVNLAAGYKVSGWIGTIDEQKHIDDQTNTIVIFANGKLIQEDILKDFQEGGVYARYVVGEVDADFMDSDNQDDVVTSDRQRVKEDDPRYKDLKDFIHRILKRIQTDWTNLRNKISTERALSNTVIKEWFDRLKGDNKKYAEKMFGKIETLHTPDRNAKKELYKASILAFETLALRDSLSVLDNIASDTDMSLIIGVFSNIDDLEATHYYQIAKGRLEVINKFAEIVPASKERVLQRYIFDHLWLLDPSWERASSNLRIEEAVTTEFAHINAKLSPDEKSGRIDIRYKTAAGKHIIIELKKYDRSVKATELVDQLRKYQSALKKCLETKFPLEPRTMECICILGAPPEPIEEEEQNIRMLSVIGARYMTYDTLIQQAQESYREYTDKHRSVSELGSLLDRLDNSFV